MWKGGILFAALSNWFSVERLHFLNTRFSDVLSVLPIASSFLEEVALVSRVVHASKGLCFAMLANTVRVVLLLN